MESFSDEQIKILEKYVSNISSNVFVVRNLPEVIKGALFSRYSRSNLGLRLLLLKDFIQNTETSFEAITGGSKENEPSSDEQMIAIQKAQNFYDRILDGYGDDSIAELGGAHLACENISMLAAKMIEDCRIGGSPLEKSTRYICFDQKVDGEYLYYKEPILMTSAYRDLYLKTCNVLFDTYSQLIPTLSVIMEEKFPKEPQISRGAYNAALRAKVLDCLRGLLPASSLTNMGVFGNGRFFEQLIRKMNAHNLTEMRDLGKEAFTELSKEIPSFIRRSDLSNPYQAAYGKFMEQMSQELRSFAQNHEGGLPQASKDGVRLIHFDQDAVDKVVASLLFPYSRANLSDLELYSKEMDPEERSRILDAACCFRENRRHKSPRALENASFTFEVIADFGIYRDLQRHRILTQERQLLTCNLGYFIPIEIQGTEMEKEYISAMDMAKKAYDAMAAELPEEAQYVVPMAYNMHWYFTLNLRALQWICELRATSAGHPNYRYVAQKMAKQVARAIPEFERFFKFVDFEGYNLGRMDQEIKREKKQQIRACQ